MLKTSSRNGFITSFIRILGHKEYRAQQKYCALQIREMSSAMRDEASQDTIGFIGLGSMGWWMSKNLQEHQNTLQCKVWNRSTEKSLAHEAQFGTVSVTDINELHDCNIIFSCLPTSSDVESVVTLLAPRLSSNTVWVDSTSGDPVVTRRIQTILKPLGVDLIDAPVSGGPDGAQQKRLSVIVGAANTTSFERVRPALESFAKQVTHVGPVGAGHAIKSINNVLNVTQLMLASEGLAALTNMGIDPNKALKAINGSSGCSLMTHERIPTDIVTRRFNYGFKLGLMLKDVRIANSVLDTFFDDAKLMRLAQQMMQHAENEIGYDADYTEVVKCIERSAGTQISSDAAKSALKMHNVSHSFDDKIKTKTCERPIEPKTR